MDFVSLDTIANTFVGLIYAKGLVMDFAAMLDCDERSPFLRKAMLSGVKSYLEFLQDEGEHEADELIELLAGSQYWKYSEMDKEWKRVCKLYNFHLR